MCLYDSGLKPSEQLATCTEDRLPQVGPKIVHHMRLFGTVHQIKHLRRFGYKVNKHITPAQRLEKKFGSRSNVCMMLGYVHHTTKIWRIWDFKSGRSGKAVECSSLIFQEEENAHGRSVEEGQCGDFGFPEQAERIYEIVEDHSDQQGKSTTKKKKPPPRNSYR